MLSTYKTGLVQQKAYRTLRHYLSTNLAEHNLTMPQWAFLGIIFDAKNIRLADIAQEMDVEAPFATLLADQLQKKGVIKRTEGRHDRRVKLISLTRKGEEIVPEVELHLKTAMRKIYNSISQAELATYIKVLQAITQEYLEGDLPKSKGE